MVPYNLERWFKTFFSSRVFMYMYLNAKHWNFITNVQILGCEAKCKSVVFTTTLITWSGFDPYPGHVVALLDKDTLRCLSLHGGFKQATNSMEKNLKKFTRTLDHWKLLSKNWFLQARSIFIAMKSVRVIQRIASDAIAGHENKYAIQQQIFTDYTDENALCASVSYATNNLQFWARWWNVR